MKYLNWLLDADKRLFLLLTLCFVLAACSKEDTDIAPDYEDGKSTVVYDLAGDTDASVGDGVDGKTKRDFKTFLFRFKDKKQIWLNNATDSAKYMKTLDWDIAFTYIYNSIVYVNHGAVNNSPGFGGPGKAAIILATKNVNGQVADMRYDEIETVPDNADFEHTQGFVGWQGWPQPGNFGWYNYSMTTHLARPIVNRAFILRTAEGKYAKLELLNVYKGNPPTVTDLFWPAPYLTFRYFVQEDGSKNLKTNE